MAFLDLDGCKGPAVGHAERNPPSTPPTVGGADYTPGRPATGSSSWGLVDDPLVAGDSCRRGGMVGRRRGLSRTGISGSRFNELVDVAWACLDLNSRCLSTMPVYRTRDGRVIEPATWMTNPDPTIYTSWHEFAKQLFWDYQLGEAFVLPVAPFVRRVSR